MNPGLVTYLHGHHARAEDAVMLLDRLVDAEAAATRRDWLTRLRDEIDADRLVIRDILQRLQIDEPAPAPRLERETPRLEALEAVTLATLAKHKLWVTLTAIARDYPPLQEINFDRLRARAIEQHALIEQERLAAAIVTLGSRRRSA